MTSTNAATVSVVVIAYNDAGLVGEAVTSALAQGPVVAEVLAVDDASSDGTASVLDELAALHPRVKVLHRAENSGGCGTPRNDGIAAATAPYVLFLDSDDVLPPGAADALVSAAREHKTPVTVGACVRRELPQHQDVPWAANLYTPGDVIERPAERTGLVRDTLCVNKLYERAFLDEHAIRFPDGRFRYEDFVFTARVLAAEPRIAVIGDLVYVWHVRRDAARVSISSTARTSATGLRASRPTAPRPGSSPSPRRNWGTPARSSSWSTTCACTCARSAGTPSTRPPGGP
ncbi:glycosyltransferase family 2 protein [Streptomyces cirratus]|uniref:glycosyltransferase family 2 protein n=1 Tax=Streptomyces cirratus TaxID=68187 RepID=UPI00360BD560